MPEIPTSFLTSFRGIGTLSRNHPNKEQVSLLQQALVYLDYNLGNYGHNKDGVDGDFGTATHDAVINFQSTHIDLNGKSLAVDGVVGPKTIGAIILALNDNTPIPPINEPGLIHSEVNVELTGPNDVFVITGQGYVLYHGTDPVGYDHWGTQRTIDLIKKVGRKWNDLYPNGPLIAIGDISLKGGGTFWNYKDRTKQDHSTHKDGLDIDIRPIRTDNLIQPVGQRDTKIDPVTFPEYDRVKTRVLIELFKELGNVTNIHFNDEKFYNDNDLAVVNELEHHGDHLHVNVP